MKLRLSEEKAHRLFMFMMIFVGVVPVLVMCLTGVLTEESPGTSNREQATIEIEKEGAEKREGEFLFKKERENYFPRFELGLLEDDEIVLGDWYGYDQKVTVLFNGNEVLLHRLIFSPDAACYIQFKEFEFVGKFHELFDKGVISFLPYGEEKWQGKTLVPVEIGSLIYYIEVS